jgi:phospholipase D-like protein
MLHWFSSRGISEPLAMAIVALGVVQLTLQIWALVDLIRRPAPTQRKVVFALVIVLVGLVGAIAYLAVGRSMLAGETSGDGGAGGNEAARKRALDELYGPDDRK